MMGHRQVQNRKKTLGHLLGRRRGNTANNAPGLREIKQAKQLNLRDVKVLNIYMNFLLYKMFSPLPLKQEL